MSEFGHNPLCEQARKIDPDVPNCICDWVDAAERDTAERIIKLLEAKADQAMRAGQGKPLPERMEYLAVETSIRQVIALIKGEN